MTTAPDSPVSVAQLVHWNGAAARANEAIRYARLSLNGYELPEGQTTDSLLLIAQQETAKTQKETRLAAGRHIAPPGGGSQLDALMRALPLELLDTPDTRELLELLTRAQAVAERVDAARGRSLGPETPLQPGESAGTDLAESISYLTLRLRGEVYGLQGRE